MPNNRVKTTKQLQSKKSGVATKKLHPESRRAKQVMRINLRTEKLAKAKKARREVEVGKVDRHIHIIHSMAPEKSRLSLQELHELLQQYIHRNTEELTKLQKERRPGRPKGKREVEIEMAVSRDTEEGRSGFLLPDLTDSWCVQLCRQWIDDPLNGDPSFLPRIKLIRISTSHIEEVVVVQDGAKQGR
ncbi:hypothetical protein BT69DRAFT_1337269 [Atractiella rhizophila]|nr:hypothetical protein BT69DRAFT_1337269 [Atractiella rhizophila]